MQQGWICLWRELLDKTVWINSNPQQKTILITLLLMANHEEKQWEWKGKIYMVKEGEFITSIKNIVSKCGKGVTTQNVRTALDRFEKLQFLTKESTNENTLIKIENWGLYQGVEIQTNKATNKRLTNDQQTTNKRLTTNNNNNNDNNDNNIFNIFSNEKIFVPLLQKWNSLSSTVPKVSNLKKDTQRYRMITQRIADYGEETVLKAIDNIKDSPFLLGNNNKGWVITFDWFIRPNNFVKVLDGNYINKKAVQSKGKYIEPQDMLTLEEKEQKLSKGEYSSALDLLEKF